MSLSVSLIERNYRIVEGKRIKNCVKLLLLKAVFQNNILILSVIYSIVYNRKLIKRYIALLITSAILIYARGILTRLVVIIVCHYNA